MATTNNDDHNTNEPSHEVAQDTNGAPHTDPDDEPEEHEDDYEGIRATALRRVFKRALDKIFKQVNYANFAACFPTPAREAPQLVGSLHEQVCGYWRRNAEVCTWLLELWELEGVGRRCVSFSLLWMGIGTGEWEGD
ncbi:hypothetical protein BJ508DRAFT_418065 [Ascobolus immersus RN42]|uniref:Uncharacterized protein n=1 Tax=Ascobolus immersus RN42 TaxID=1160509 RepID=A0A3N4HQ92_ASCIM|nr:hypothetical protein BJ508DRAFT_418065 [Ascobolus immersus RN42]